MKSLIFVVDSQREIRELAQESLEAAGYAVRAFSNTEANFREKHEPPALIIAGMNPQNKVHSADQPFESFNSTGIPWILLLDESSEEHCLMATESGAEDYLRKPFRPRELVARVQAALHRSAFTSITRHDGVADIVIDSWAMKLLVRGIEIPTTALEFRLVDYLARHRGQVFTRDFLLDAVWGDLRFIGPRSVDACIRRIREKIEADRSTPTMLKTVRGVGYRLDATAAWQSAPDEICNCAACRTGTTPLRFQGLALKRKRA